jgi:SPP1 gp7 family putative phage head morphogenesis protein
VRALLVPIAGRRPRRRTPPRPIPPTLIELDYARSILVRVEMIREAFAPLLAELPALLEAAARERHDEGRADAGESRRVRELVTLARERLRAALDERALDALAHSIARRTEQHQQAQLRRQVRAVLGTDVLLTDRKLASVMEGFVAENVALIKADLGEVAARVEKVVTRGVSSGLRWQDIGKDIDASFDFGRERAHFIARDQVGKFYGQVNETRQKDLGLDEYIWRTSRDARVRGNPTGKFPRSKPSHFAREGVRFKWSEPPEDGHPGEPVICRCYAEPVLDPLLK